MSGSRTRVLLSGVAAALTLALTACGVPPSDVIQAGEPASGMPAPGPTPPAPFAVHLYFWNNGDVVAYPRRINGPGDLGNVVDQLFSGPTASEAMTATTQLPRLSAAPTVVADSGTGVSVKLPKGVAPLSQRAMLQVACTVAHAANPSGTPPANADAAGSGAPVASPAPTESSPVASPAPTESSPVPTSVRVSGDGWAMTQSTAPCPTPYQP
ncbi:hypothetical protein [Streptomyces sp. NPDC090022]|uniref:hypothetical protein n=1 Tax=Streptomyces sp. NPDC090022 TaxID=3365920 RepID=UPI003830B174